MPSPTIMRSPVQGGFKGTYALSGVSSPLAAFSVRKLFPNSPSACMRIRRSLDNAEEDIGYCYDVVSREYVVCSRTIANFCGGYNMLLNSEDATATGWTSSASTIAQVSVTNPIGGSTCSRITGNGVNTQHSVSAGATTVNTAPVTASVYAKAGTHQFLQIRFSAAIYGGAAVNFDLTNGTYKTMPFGGNAVTEITMTDVGNGWYRCSARTTNNASAGTGNIGFYLVTSLDAISNESNTLTTNLYIWGAQLQTGSLVAYTKTGAGQSGFGYVTTWYDQSGNGYHVTQSTAAKQPRVMNMGVLDTQNSIPTTVYTTASTVELSNAVVLNSAVGISCVYAIKATGNNVVFGSGTSTTGISISEISYVTNVSKASDRYPTASDTSNSLKIITGENSGASPVIYKNGTALSVGSGIAGSAYTTKLAVGSTGGGVYPTTSDISEALVFAHFGDTERKALEASQLKFFKVV